VTDDGTDPKYIDELREVGIEVIVAETQRAQPSVRKNRSNTNKTD
jgi:hypothetical protein